MCPSGVCNEAFMPFRMPPKKTSEVGAMRDEERAEEKEEAREEEEEEEEEEEKKYEEEEEEEEEEKDDDDDDYEVDDDDDYEVDDDDDDDVDDDDVDDDDVGEILKKTKRKPATKIANQRRKIRRFPNRKTCCFAGAQGYSCRHKGDSNVRATRCVPESERKNFPEDARCCDACYRHFKCLNVTCCFVDAKGYSCHKGKSNAQARKRVPESERKNFPEDAMCCDACCNHFKYSNVPCCFADAEGYSCRHKGDSNFQVRSRVPESERKNFPEDARCCNACCNHFKCSNVTCCFADAEGYSCRHKGDSNAQATRCVPESERNNFPEDAMCCEACYRHFKYSNVPCCFAGAQGYSCHKGDSNAQARNRVPESERNKFPEDARCCATCYNHLQDAYFFHLGRVCSDCLLLGYDPATTPGAWMAWRGLHGNTLLCSKCFANKSKERVRRRKGIMKRRKGRKAKGDW